MSNSKKNDAIRLPDDPHALHEALLASLATLDQWTGFRADYSALHATLTTLPAKVRHPVVVPLGPLAFMPGHLVHTNEITVLLGDNWFVERSAAQAAAIVERRIEFVDQKLDEARDTAAAIRAKREEMASGAKRAAMAAAAAVAVRPVADTIVERLRPAHAPPLPLTPPAASSKGQAPGAAPAATPRSSSPGKRSKKPSTAAFARTAPPAAASAPAAPTAPAKPTVAVVESTVTNQNASAPVYFGPPRPPATGASRLSPRRGTATPSHSGVQELDLNEDGLPFMDIMEEVPPEDGHALMPSTTQYSARDLAAAHRAMEKARNLGGSSSTPVVLTSSWPVRSASPPRQQQQKQSQKQKKHQQKQKQQGQALPDHEDQLAPRKSSLKKTPSATDLARHVRFAVPAGPTSGSDTSTESDTEPDEELARHIAGSTGAAAAGAATTGDAELEDGEVSDHDHRAEKPVAGNRRPIADTIVERAPPPPRPSRSLAAAAATSPTDDSDDTRDEDNEDPLAYDMHHREVAHAYASSRSRIASQMRHRSDVMLPESELGELAGTQADRSRFARSVSATAVAVGRLDPSASSTDWRAEIQEGNSAPGVQERRAMYSEYLQYLDDGDKGGEQQQHQLQQRAQKPVPTPAAPASLRGGRTPIRVPTTSAPVAAAAPTPAAPTTTTAATTSPASTGEPPKRVSKFKQARDSARR
ncbi:hypothetical protein BC828DRAFT_404780 [Blastocladiella britannica]|nr:hypothetical protein BC828DRAFT_404780 [Blastocladiella britannica]